MTKEDRKELERLEQEKNKIGDEARRLEMLLEKARRVYWEAYSRYAAFRDLMYENPNISE